jgi:ABC-type multidrug transport system fused ATPase/permease subunit
MTTISFGSLFLRFRWRISLTFTLVIVESLLEVLYPLLIGFAINDLLAGRYEGLIRLGMLGVTSVLIGSSRRYYDTRIYSGIYQMMAVELVEREQAAGSSVSRTSAHTNMLTEFVDFLEDTIPELIGALVAVVGILVVTAGLSLPVFLGCLALFLLVILVYTTTARRNYRLNTGYNNQFEETVDAIASKRKDRLRNHFHRIMQWNVRLSDLETLNYAVFWIGAVALFLFTPYSAISAGVLEYGLVFSLLLYVFEFIDWLSDLPLHIQQVIRLREISKRLTH